MSRRRKVVPIHHAQKDRQVWTREALAAARLMPPSETEGQACWCCGRAVIKTMFGYQPRLAEIKDAYGRLCLCLNCLKSHMSVLSMDQGAPAPSPTKSRHLPTYDEWAEGATVEELQQVMNRMKARLRKGQ